MKGGREGRGQLEPKQGETALAHGSQPWPPIGITWESYKIKKQQHSLIFGSQCNWSGVQPGCQGFSKLPGDS